jgi:hypothetical protein
MTASWWWRWEASLEVGLGRRHWAVVEDAAVAWAVLAAEEHAMMALASALSKLRYHYYNIGISVGKDGESGRVHCKGCVSEAMARK